FAVLPWAEQFQTWLPSHAMAQSANVATCNRNPGQVEEPELRSWLASDLLDDLHGIWALNLVPVSLANDRTWPRYRSLISFEFYVISAAFRVVLNPIVHRGPPDEVEQILFEIKENHIADHVSVVVAGHKLLSPVWFEAFEAVHPKVGQQFKRIR